MTNKRTGFVKQAMFLSVCGIIVRIIGVIYSIPLTNIIGDLGNGYYSSAYNMYSIILLICSYSVPMAISKIVSEKSAIGEYKTAHRIFRCSVIYVVAVSALAAILTYIFAPGIVDVPEAVTAMRILAPTIFISGCLSVLRGYFQAQNTMIPTAISQLLEQVFNAIFSILAAYLWVKAYQGMDENLTARYGAAGGAVGTGVGVIIGFLFLLITYMAYRPVYRKRLVRKSDRYIISYPDAYKMIFRMVTPVIISTCIYNISTVLDMKIFYWISEWKQEDVDATVRLYGIFSRKFNPLANVPIAIASSMVAALVPEISMAYAKKEIGEVKQNVGNAMKYSMLFIIPAFCGMAVLSRPIIDFLYPGSDKAAVYLLRFGGLSILFSSVSTVLNGVLQGIGKVSVPMKNAAAALVLHILLLVPLLMFTELKVYAILLAASIYGVVISVLNYRAIIKYLGYHQELKKTFGVPFSAAGVMSLCAWLIYKSIYILGEAWIPSQTVKGGLAVILSVIVAVFVYFFIVIKFGYTKEEVQKIPLLSKLF